MKNRTTVLLIAGWLLFGATPPAVSATEVSDFPATSCAVTSVQEEEDCDKYDFDFDVEFSDEGDIHIDIDICKLKEKRTTITTVVVETDEGTEITTETVVECDYGRCGVEEL